MFKNVQEHCVTINNNMLCSSQMGDKYGSSVMEVFMLVKTGFKLGQIYMKQNFNSFYFWEFVCWSIPFTVCSGLGFVCSSTHSPSLFSKCIPKKTKKHWWTLVEGTYLPRVTLLHAMFQWITKQKMAGGRDIRRNHDCLPEPVFFFPSPKSDYTVSAIKIVQFCM